MASVDVHRSFVHYMEQVGANLRRTNVRVTALLALWTMPRNLKTWTDRLVLLQRRRPGIQELERGNRMRARFLGSCLALALLAGAVGCNVKQPSNVTAKPKQGEHSTQPNEGG